jgi:hypothetical protein
MKTDYMREMAVRVIIGCAVRYGYIRPGGYKTFGVCTPYTNSILRL